MHGNPCIGAEFSCPTRSITSTIWAIYSFANDSVATVGKPSDQGAV